MGPARPEEQPAGLTAENLFLYGHKAQLWAVGLGFDAAPRAVARQSRDSSKERGLEPGSLASGPHSEGEPSAKSTDQLMIRLPPTLLALQELLETYRKVTNATHNPTTLWPAPLRFF